MLTQQTFTNLPGIVFTGVLQLSQEMGQTEPESTCFVDSRPCS